MSTPKNYYFMAGFPRAGSTLLSAILNQNPRFYSGPSSPVVLSMLTLEQALSKDELYNAYPKPAQATALIANTLPTWYSDIDKPVIIDKNRSWINHMHYISGYFGIQPKVLFPIRSVPEILASFISMYHRNPYKGGPKVPFLDEMLIKAGLPLTDDNRCQALCHETGILGSCYRGLQQVYAQGNERQVHLIEYDDLINMPEDTMRRIYNFLEEDYYEHDFTAIENIHQERDLEVYGLPDMHAVRPTLKKTSVKPEDVLSTNILAQCRGVDDFWRYEHAINNSGDVSSSTDDEQTLIK